MPPAYGARQLNGQKGFVLSLPTTNSVEVGINSVVVDPFISSPMFKFRQSATPPQIVAIGDISFGQINSSVSIGSAPYIPGSFQNVSP